MTLTPERVIARFAASVGRPDEAQLYLELWQRQPAEKFALIDAAGLADDAGTAALVADLHFLAAIRLFPMLVGCQDEAVSSVTRSGVASAVVVNSGEAAAAARKGLVAVSTSRDTSSWLLELAPRKLIVLGGALCDAGGEPISLLSVAEERSAPTEFASGDQHRFDGAAALLRSAPQPLTIGFTSPFDLLRELFTVRGAGTLLRRGSSLEVLGDVSPSMRSRLAALFAEAFGKTLREEFFHRPHASVIVAGDYRGAAVIDRTEVCAYLSKFAVGTEARGEGVGRDLWRAVTANHARLLWRARPGNPVADWYTRNADGFQRLGEYTIFWRGLLASELGAAIEFAAAQPDDFEPAPRAVT